MSIENQLLVVQILILIAFYLTLTKSIWFTHCLKDVFGYALTGQLTILKKTFRKKKYPKNFIDVLSCSYAVFISSKERFLHLKRGLSD